MSHLQAGACKASEEAGNRKTRVPGIEARSRRADKRSAIRLSAPPLRAAAFLLLVLTGPARAEGAVAPPTEEARAAARELAEATGLEGQLQQTLGLMRGQMMQMIQRGAPNKSPAEVARTVDEVLLPEIRARLGELRDILIELNAENYSVDDMKELRAFYATPLGQRVLKVAPVVGAQGFAAGRAWGEQVGRDAIQKNAEELRRRGVTL